MPEEKKLKRKVVPVPMMEGVMFELQFRMPEDLLRKIDEAEKELKAEMSDVNRDINETYLPQTDGFLDKRKGELIKEKAEKAGELASTVETLQAEGVAEAKRRFVDRLEGLLSITPGETVDMLQAHELIGTYHQMYQVREFDAQGFRHEQLDDQQVLDAMLSYQIDQCMARAEKGAEKLDDRFDALRGIGSEFKPFGVIAARFTRQQGAARLRDDCGDTLKDIIERGRKHPKDRGDGHEGGGRGGGDNDKG